MNNPQPDQPRETEGFPLEQLPDQVLIKTIVGALVMRLSYLHFVLEINLWSILGIDEGSGRVLTEDLPFKSLIHRFERTIRLKNPSTEVSDRLKKAFAQLEKVNDKRNKIVHGFWTFPGDGSPLLIPKKGPVTQMIAPTVTELAYLIKETEQFEHEFFICMNLFNNRHLSHEHLEYLRTLIEPHNDLLPGDKS